LHFLSMKPISAPASRQMPLHRSAVITTGNA
jgi:hypothetical protein